MSTRHRAVKLAAAMTLAAAATPAAAGDQSLRMNFSQRFIADSNVQLQQGDEFSFGSLSSLGISYANRRPTSALSLSTGFGYNFFSGEDNSNLDGLFPRLNGSYVVNRPNRSIRFNFGGSVQPVEFFTRTGLLLVPEDPDTPDEPDPTDANGNGVPDSEEDPDLGEGDPDDIDDGSEDLPPAPTVITATESNDALRISYNVGAGYSQRINTRETIAFNGNIGRLDFIGDDDGRFTPSTSLGAGASYGRTLTDKINAGGGVSASFFQAEDDSNRQSLSLSIGPSLTWRRTPVEVYRFSLGPAYTMTRFDQLTAGGRRRGVSEEAFSLRGSAGINYTTAGGSYSALLSQGVTPADEGVLVNQTTLNLSVNQRLSSTSSASAGLATTYRTALNGDQSSGFDDDIFSIARLSYTRRINPRSSGSISTFAQVDDDGGPEEVVTGFSLGYNHRLTEKIAANLGYTFRLDRSGQEDLTSHRVGLTFSRSFVVIP